MRSTTNDTQKLGARLDSLLASRFAHRPDQNRIRRASELPRRLEHCVGRLAFDCEWRAYRLTAGVFFAAGRSSALGAGTTSRSAIEVYFLDDSAAVYSAAVWEHDARHGWWLDSIITPSYDCERGWWMEALSRSAHTALVLQGGDPDGG